MVVNTPPRGRTTRETLGLNVFARGDPRHSRAALQAFGIFSMPAACPRGFTPPRGLRGSTERQLNSVVKEPSDPGMARHHC